MKYQSIRGSAGYWHWRLFAENGQTIAQSSESYFSKKDAVVGVEEYRHVLEVSSLEVVMDQGTGRQISADDASPTSKRVIKEISKRRADVLQRLADR